MPLGEQQFQDFGAGSGEQVEALFSLLFLAPLAGQESLAFQPAQQGVERAFIDLQAVLREGFAQRVTVLLAAQRRQDGQYQAAAAEFETEILKVFWIHGVYQVLHSVLYTLCIT